MKKIQLRLFSVIIILFLLPLFFIVNPTPLFAENITITLKGVIRSAGAPNYLNNANSVFVSGDYEYVASSRDDSLSIFNISNPSNPTLAGVIRGEGAPNYLHGANSVFVSGDYAYVTSDEDNSLSIFEIVTVQTPEEATQDLIADIEDLNLQGEIENSLISKLEAAINSLNNGQENAAINQLNAFINQVEAQRGKKIADEQADELIAEAQRIIDNI